MNKFRSTDAPVGPPLPKVITNATEARITSENSVRTHCGWCHKNWTGHHVPDHRCVDPVSGRDFAEAKRLSALGARRAFAALNDWQPPPCMYCHWQGPPGAGHNCPGGSQTPMPHEQQARDWQLQGAAQLVADLDSAKGAS